jgi:hypothetical protein
MENTISKSLQKRFLENGMPQETLKKISKVKLILGFREIFCIYLKPLIGIVFKFEY